MSVNFFNEDTAFPKISKRYVAKWVKEVIQLHEFKAGDLSFIFCSDDYLLDVNKKFLEHDYYTDIITFDYVDGKLISGDIFISVDRVNDNSVSFGISFSNELYRVIIHGVLHLLGFGDKTEQEKLIMRQREDQCLALLNEN